MIRKYLVILLFIALAIYAETKVVAYSYMTDPNSDDIDYSKITHLVGSFVKSDLQGNLIYDSWTPADKMLQVLNKAKQSGVVTMIALGTSDAGWEMTKSKSARAKFVTNLVEYCVTNGINGIDLDLEGRAGSATWPFYPEPYESLAVELRSAMPDSMLLTSAVGSHSNHGAQWTNRFLDQLDWINVMIYDRALSWESSPVENHSTYGGHLEAANYWHNDRGLDKSRVVLGVPFYARGWDRDNNRVYREDPGWEVTTWDYKDFINREEISLDQDTLDISATDSVKYPRAEGVTGRATLFFNSVDMIAQKTQWSIDSGYGGMMIWHIAGDVPTTDDKSLLGAIDSVINGVVTPIEDFTFKKTSSLKIKVLKNNIQISGLKKGAPYELAIFNVSGKIIDQKSFNPNGSDKVLGIAKNSIAKGTYFSALKGNGERLIQKFTIN